MMRISEFLSVLLANFVLVLGFLVLEGNFFPAIAHLRVVIPENTSYNWEELREVYKYAANNIFEKGYMREVGPEIHPRLLSFPDGKSPEKGSFVVPANSSKGIVKLALPSGFKDGILSLQITTKSAYKIGVSYDLKNWKFYDYPGFAARALAIVSMEKGDVTNGYAYLKFFPSKDENLSVYFDVFQYTSDLLYDENEYYGVLFYPEVDIDYEGKNIIRPAIYGKYSPKKNN